MRGSRARAALSIGAAFLLVACGSGSTPTATPAGGGGGSATSKPGGGGTGGDVSGLKACSLLTVDEIKSTMGVAMKDGVEQDSDGQVDCEWNPQDDSIGAGVSVTVATYDDVLWKTMASSALAKSVSGFGDAAFSNYPHPGDLSIKTRGYIVTIGIVDFRSGVNLDANDATFANLVLSRL